MEAKLPKFLERKEGTIERLDRFELIAELASGGMATVFLARLSGVGGFQRFVAIKRLHPHLAREHDFIQMFLDEARLAARLHHPNVVPILEIGATDDGYYLVMEYIEGDTLGRLMARSATSGKPMPANVAIRVALDALAGLHAAHELVDDDGKGLEIVHRDVSPQNILVGVDGSTRITDFGVARAATRLTTTRSGQLKGKLAYMAPEQAKGNKGVDRRADIFAMGIVVWETLARKRLFKGDGEADTLNRVMHEPIPTLLSANPEIDAGLDAVVMKALARDPDDRFVTARDFADALEKAAAEAKVLGSHRDVQTHLDAIMGTDISQQREAVRAWIARSEPSKHGDPRLDGPLSRKKAVPSELASLTKVEAGRASRSPTSSPSSPSSKPDNSEDATVSGVSSAVLLAVPSAPSSGNAEVSTASSVTAQVTAPAEVGRKKVGVWMTALAIGVLAGAAFAVGRWRSDPPETKVQPASPSVAAAASAPPVVGAAASVSAAPATIVVAPSASVITPESSASVTKPSARPPRQPPQKPGSKPTVPPVASVSTPPSTSVPDDISHNPYR